MLGKHACLLYTSYRLREPQTIDESIVESLRNFSEVITAWTDFDLSDEERFEVNALARRFLAIAGKIENINTLEGEMCIRDSKR